MYEHRQLVTAAGGDWPGIAAAIALASGPHDGRGFSGHRLKSVLLAWAWLGKYGNLHAGGETIGAIDLLRGLLVVALFGFENIRYKFLWVAIVEREPGALYLHHDAMTLFKDVVRGVKVDGERRHFARGDRFRFFE